MYKHKVSLIKHFGNGMSQIREVTFESSDSNYGSSVLQLICERPELHNCTPFEPVTLSPITFDFTTRYKSLKTGNTVPSDRYFTSYADMVQGLEAVESNTPDHLKFIENTEPFCRVIFSQAGCLDDFYSRSITGYKKKPYTGSPWVGDKFKTIYNRDSQLMTKIKTGCYHEFDK